MKLNGQILLLYNFYYYTLSCFSKLCMWLFSHYVCTQIITAWVAPFLGTRNFLPFDYKRHFPDFFPLLQFLFHRVLKHEKMCVISQSSLDCYFQVVGSYFFSFLAKKFMEHVVLIQYFDTDSKV